MIYIPGDITRGMKRAFERVRAAQGMETREGQDPAERLGAEHDSPVAESDAPNLQGSPSEQERMKR